MNGDSIFADIKCPQSSISSLLEAEIEPAAPAVQADVCWAIWGHELSCSEVARASITPSVLGLSNEAFILADEPSIDNAIDRAIWPCNDCAAGHRFALIAMQVDANACERWRGNFCDQFSMSRI